MTTNTMDTVTTSDTVDTSASVDHSLFPDQVRDPELAELLAQFFVEFHDTLMQDPEAVVDWQLQEDKTSFCFRVALPYVSSTDMIGAPVEPLLTPGEPVPVADSEHLCPLTYLAYKKFGVCYDVSHADHAARQLGLPELVRDTIIATSDQPCTGTLFYWQLRALFEQKEQQLLSLHNLHDFHDFHDFQALHSTPVQDPEGYTLQNS